MAVDMGVGCGRCNCFPSPLVGEDTKARERSELAKVGEGARRSAQPRPLTKLR